LRVNSQAIDREGRGCHASEGGDHRMEWTTPEFVEVKMDAEINSYQDDFSGI
jgi:coenzyme PQQ precursor peptide PqqA